jgi:hypothetical protein
VKFAITKKKKPYALLLDTKKDYLTKSTSATNLKKNKLCKLGTEGTSSNLMQSSYKYICADVHTHTHTHTHICT